MLSILLLAGCSGSTSTGAAAASAEKAVGVHIEVLSASHYHSKNMAAGMDQDNLTVRLTNSAYQGTFVVEAPRGHATDGIWYTDPHPEPRNQAGCDSSNIYARQGETVTCQLVFEKLPSTARIVELEVAFYSHDPSVATNVVLYPVPSY